MRTCDPKRSARTGDHWAVDDFELLDFGEGMRLERFGSRIVARPHPGANGLRGDPGAWRSATLTYEPERGWSGPDTGDPWQIGIDGLTVELRQTETGQVGLFPEQRDSWAWIRHRVAQGMAVLNLFAYSGLATLVAAAEGASVVHVDASRPTVAWARRNADLSGLAGRPVRWIVDDAAAFVAREIRRGHRYDGIVLDPPSYGHGPRGRGWRLEDDLAPLLRQVAQLVDGPKGFVLLTAHTPGFGPDRLAAELAAPFGMADAGIERGALQVTARTRATLDLGAFARWPGR
jgi:23S rRNA (cytosine1962-C5)-methyltransferase